MENLTIDTFFEYENYSLDFIDSAYFLASLQCPKIIVKEDGRAPIDLICVIDKSGSMAGNKIELVKKSILFTLDQLSENDKLGIVTFDSEVSVELSITNVNVENKVKIKEIIQNIEVGSSTNISDGLMEGFDMLQKLLNPNQVTSIILFTDGLPNNGIQDTEEMKLFISKQLKELKKPITLFSFGFGVDHDPNLLSDIATVGNGLYYFIEKEEEIISSFAGCIGGLLTVVAQDVNIIIHRDVVPRSSYEYITDTNKTQVVVGDIYTEEHKDLLFKVNLPKIDNPMLEEIKIEVKYFDVILKEIKTITTKVQTKREEKIVSQQANYKLDIQRNRTNTTEILENVKKYAEKEKMEEAKNLIKLTIISIEKSISSKDEFCKGLVQDLNSLLSQIENKSSYSMSGNKMLADFLLSTKKQRSTNLSLSSTNSYSTSMKDTLKQKSINGGGGLQKVDSMKKINPNFWLKLKVPTSVAAFLKQINLENYSHNFQVNGYDDISIFPELEKKDFTDIDISVLGHLKLLETKCIDLKKNIKLRIISSEDVSSFLRSIDMSEYLKNFIENGYDRIEIFPKMNKQDYIDIGITLKGHIRKLEIYSQKIQKK